MKKLLATIILAASSFTATAGTLSIGQARISHFLEEAVIEEGYGAGKVAEIHFNEENEFIDYAYGKEDRVHVGAFENSFGDIAPYISVDFFKHTYKKAEFVANVGATYYKSNMTTATLKATGETLDYEILDVTPVLPLASLTAKFHVTKNLVIGATASYAYAGGFAAIQF